MCATLSLWVAWFSERVAQLATREAGFLPEKIEKISSTKPPQRIGSPHGPTSVATETIVERAPRASEARNSRRSRASSGSESPPRFPRRKTPGFSSRSRPPALSHARAAAVLSWARSRPVRQNRVKGLNFLRPEACPQPNEESERRQFVRVPPHLLRLKVLPLEPIENPHECVRVFPRVCLSANAEVRPVEHSFHGMTERRLEVIAAAQRSPVSSTRPGCFLLYRLDEVRVKTIALLN